MGEPTAWDVSEILKETPRTMFLVESAMSYQEFSSPLSSGYFLANTG